MSMLEGPRRRRHNLANMPLSPDVDGTAVIVVQVATRVTVGLLQRRRFAVQALCPQAS